MELVGTPPGELGKLVVAALGRPRRRTLAAGTKPLLVAAHVVVEGGIEFIAASGKRWPTQELRELRVGVDGDAERPGRAGMEADGRSGAHVVGWEVDAGIEDVRVRHSPQATGLLEVVALDRRTDAGQARGTQATACQRVRVGTFVGQKVVALNHHPHPRGDVGPGTQRGDPRPEVDHCAHGIFGKRLGQFAREAALSEALLSFVVVGVEEALLVLPPRRHRVERVERVHAPVEEQLEHALGLAFDGDHRVEFVGRPVTPCGFGPPRMA